jgi:hypothetical protein
VVTLHNNLVYFEMVVKALLDIGHRFMNVIK